MSMSKKIFCSENDNTRCVGENTAVFMARQFVRGVKLSVEIL